MTFDKKEHQEIVLELINQASFPGRLVDLVVELKNAVTLASVSGEPAQTVAG